VLREVSPHRNYQSTIYLPFDSLHELNSKDWLVGNLFNDAFSITRLYSVDDMMTSEL
jgi:hypothetical protein